MAAKRKRRTGTLMHRVAIAMAVCMSASALLVGLFRWVDPPTSAFMIEHWVAGRLASGRAPEVHHEWTDWSSIPPAVKLAVIAAEDQRFPRHRGFDAVEIRRALQQHLEGGRLRGASTITQQTAKNLFLWSGRDPLRKGLEAWFTLLIEGLWSKERILEVYLNIAQLGPDTFGVGAASWRYFDRPVVALDAQDAALIAAVLPNPNVYRLDAPSTSVRRREAWIRGQMSRLGGIAYLNAL
ncbi:MAG: monofunctional biosynthetic peptidoglycan transglycosylase [Thiocapsa sp.]|jgi:monofunctional biosynthetic peptidoglycan transglycosylase|nr:monofunctional biosynthetic peptidoglycan transglycosylase [Thiocapsa sp.]MCG6897746.1 monofunctional biosynthetic peptidoglycan transglycosylase [Thiocapsa sp.]MCG6985161.1 monofunctional biosynthetic peptidoglycan transglycosylase [Thiocapsa sp.]